MGTRVEGGDGADTDGDDRGHAGQEPSVEAGGRGSDGGALVVVGTPIGNLDDLSPRAAQALADADAIACEDTRRTGRLLELRGLSGPRLLVANEHTEAARADDVVHRVAGGQRVALVSDAGMPGVADPGRVVVAAVAAAGLPVEVIPGPTAVTAAVAVSGFGADRFVFEGFLPRKGRARRERLAEVAVEPRTLVLYESPHRLAATLADLARACGAERPAVVARELTKLHEELARGTLGVLAEDFDGRAAVKGEIVIVIQGAPATTVSFDDEGLRALLAPLLAQGVSTRDAVAAVVAETGTARRRVYGLAVDLAAGGSWDEADGPGRGDPVHDIDGSS